MGFASLGGFSKTGRRRIIDGSSAYRAGDSAAQIKGYTNTNISGLYWVKPNRGVAAQQVHCEMLVDGGGWMLIARCHPGASGLTVNQWGWLGGSYGAVGNYSQPYHLGYKDWYAQGHRFTQLMHCNRKNINNSEIGPFAYKRTLVNSQIFFAGDGWLDFSNNPASTVKNDLSIYGTTNYPSMQGCIGLAQSAYNAGSVLYHMRDVSPLSGYGISPAGVGSEYYGSETNWTLTGAWGERSGGTDGSGNFNQSTGDTRSGGTSIAMIFVK